MLDYKDGVSPVLDIVATNELIPLHYIPEIIRLNETVRLEWWSRKFGVSLQNLSVAVTAVGGDPEAVRAFLRKRT
jgi:Protein of unknown function (DUF3606)